MPFDVMFERVMLMGIAIFLGGLGISAAIGSIMGWWYFFKVIKGAGIAAAGAALTWLAQNISGMDFGPWTLVVVPIASTLVNAALKWLTNTQAIVRKEP